MTKEDAIDIIKSECYVFNPLNFDRSTMVNTALDMAIKALEFDLDKHDEEVIKNTVETLWGEPCEDCISREDAIKVFGDVHPMDYNTQAYVTKIQNLPSVTPKPKTGRWIYIQYDGNHRIGNWKCSLCMRNVMFGQNQNDKPLYNYCPKCGAKMQEAEE